MKKILVWVCIIILSIVSIGSIYLLLSSEKTKTFEGKGVTVELTSSFKEYESKNWDYYLENDDIAFMSNRLGKLSSITTPSGDSFQLLKLSLESYLNLMLASYEIPDTTTYLVEGYHGDFYYCYYTVGEKYGYMLMVIESENFFYTINFSTSYDSFQEMKPLLLSYAVTIEVE